MKKIMILACALTLASFVSAQERVQLKNFTDSASYAIGYDVVKGWMSQNLGINGVAAGQGMIDAMTGKYELKEEQVVVLLQRFQQQFEERQRMMQQPADPEKVAANVKAGKDFMTQNANNKSVRTTQSGLQYQCLQAGQDKADRPKAGQHVTVHYTGTLIDGRKFDSSLDRNKVFEFDLGRGQVIPGWDEGVQLMERGSKYRFVIPYNLAYGEREIGVIPAGSTLIFEVELIDFK